MLTPMLLIPMTSLSLFAAIPRPDVTPLVNADIANEADVPMAGAIGYRDSFTSEEGEVTDIYAVGCSSILIAPDVVLTAAHCLSLRHEQINPEEDVTPAFWSPQTDLLLYALGPELDLAVEAPPTNSIEIKDMVIHEGFSADNSADPLGRLDDIGLAFLDEPVVDSPFAYVPPVEDDSVESDALGTVVGWGLQFNEEQLPDDVFAYVGIKRWGVSLVAEAGPWEFVLGASASDTRQCFGDSGGPVILGRELESDEPHLVVGIASRLVDDSLCMSFGAINTRVAAYRDWIEQEMKAACEEGRRVWCEDPGLASVPELDTDSVDDSTTSGQGGESQDEDSRGCSVSRRGASASWPGLLGLLFGGWVFRACRRARATGASKPSGRA